MLEREQTEDVLLLRFAHGKASALDLELCDAFATELEAFAASPARALILTGTGRIFSAGVDLVRVVEGGRAYLERFLPALERALRALLLLEKPAICALNGHAIAGGCLIAAACDRRIAAAGSATFGVPELVVGVPFPPAALEALRSLLDPRALQEAALLGATYPVGEARALGLVDEIVEPDALLPRAHELARRLAALPARSFALTKRMLRRPVVALLERHDVELDETMLEAWSSPDVLAAIGEYVQRTLKR